MALDLGKDRDDDRAGDRDDGPPRPEPAARRHPTPARLEQALEDIPVDETRLSPLGVRLPGGWFLSDTAFQFVRFLGLGLWIFAYTWAWEAGFSLMWAWIAANAAYGRAIEARRRRRKQELRALRLEAAGGPLAGLPPTTPPPPPGPGPAPVVEVPRITDAERALIATVRRVDTCGRFERVDLVLVHEVADVLGPLLVRVAEQGADVRVRHDLQTVAAEHLPRTVDDFLALPADYAHQHRTPAGTTPAEELRTQLHLLLEGCRSLRVAVHDADVTRQQQQSRFLEAKFRGSDLDLQHPSTRPEGRP